MALFDFDKRKLEVQLSPLQFSVDKSCTSTYMYHTVPGLDISRPKLGKNLPVPVLSLIKFGSRSSYNEKGKVILIEVTSGSEDNI